MNPSYPTPLDPVSKQLRRIPWARWLMYASGALLALGGLMYVWMRSYVTISVAPDTTVLTAPLLADGYPDYVGYLNERNAAGVVPAENAWIVLLRGIETPELDAQDRAKHWELLSLPAEPLNVNCFRPFLSQDALKRLPQELLAASSRVGQPLWAIRFAKLAAQNAEKRLEQAVATDANFPVLDTLESLLEFLPQRIAAAAEQESQALGSADRARWEEENDYLGFVPIEESEPFPDLSESALTAALPSELITPEEIAEWRQEQFNNARQALFEREQNIVTERPWSREECPIAAAWLDAQSANLDRLTADLAARSKMYMPYRTSDDVPQMFAVFLPQMQTLRNISQMLQIRAWQAIYRGDLDAATRDAEAQLRLTNLLPQQPLLVELLIMHAIHGQAVATIRDIAQHPNVTEQQLAKLAQALDRHKPQGNYAAMLEMERLATIDYVVSTVARGQKGNVNDPDDYWERSIVCWDEVLRRTNELYDEAVAAAKADDWSAMQQLASKIETEPANYLELQRAYSERSWMLLPSQRTEVMKYALPRLFLKALCNIYPITRRVAVRHDAARTMIALERFRLVNKSYPAAIFELVPAYLPAPPVDAYTNQVFSYARTPQGYRAYSWGLNEQDDAGELSMDDEGGFNFGAGDLVIGSPDEIPRRQNLAW